MKKPQLFMLHFAGGNSYSFQFLTELLTDFEVMTPELPGRGRRIGEPLLTDFNRAAHDLYDQLLPRIGDKPFLVYGHSMGAYLALRLVNLLERAGKYPACLLVSGNPGPGVRNPKNYHLLTPVAFMEKVQQLGGLPPEFTQDPDLVDFFEPILRSDFEISERNLAHYEPPVQCSLYAMMGSEEEDVDLIGNWGRFTQSQFDYEVMDGNHFFIHRHPQRLAQVIQNCYHSVRVMR